MSRLNRSKPFGEVHPVEIRPDTDRPTAYEQGGKWFDSHDREIVPGKPLGSEPDEAPVVEPAAPQEPPPMTVSDLIGGFDGMPDALFKREAKRILGPACPASKTDMLSALNKVAVDIADKQQRHRKRTPRAKPEVADQDPPDTGDEKVEAKPAKPAKVAKGKAGEVDLKKWATGQEDRLFSEVRKAIRQKYSKQIAGPNERMEALQFLIEKKVVTAAQARRDIQEQVFSP